MNQRAIVAQVFLLSALLVRPAAAEPFVYGANEQLVYSTDFNDASGLVLTGDIEVAGGELHGGPSCFFCSATHQLDQRLDLNAGAVTAYYSFRTDIAQGEELGKAYLRLNLTDDPSLNEQLAVVLNVRPGSPAGLYALYIDPGENIPNELEQGLQPPAGTFSDTATYEDFKMVLDKTGADEVQISAFWFDRVTQQWDLLQPRPGSIDPFVASISGNFGGLSSFAALQLQFGHGVPYANAFAITQAVTIPEPDLLPGLAVLGTLAAGWYYRYRGT